MTQENVGKEQQLVKALHDALLDAVIYKPSAGKRVAAFLIDVLFACALAAPFIVAGRLMVDYDVGTDYLLLVVFGGLGLAAVYLFAKDGILGGRSVGRRVMGLTVTKFDCISPCNVFQSVVRQLPFAAGSSLIPFLGGLFELYFIATKPFGLRLGDMYSKSVVFDRGQQQRLREAFDKVAASYQVTPAQLKALVGIAFLGCISEEPI